MGATTTSTLANEYQKYFSKKLLTTQIQLTVLDQFALTRPLPKNVGAKIISFFRRSASVNNSSGLVAAVQTLAEGVPISTFTDFTLDRIDVPLIQYGEACKVTDILTMTDLFDALQMNIDGMSEDAALHADDVMRNAIIAATQTGITLQQASGTTTAYIGKLYAQNAADFTALSAASVSAGKVTALDFVRAATQLFKNRAPRWGADYVAVVPPEVSFDLQNDPDWIDAANYGAPTQRFKGELGKYGSVRFVQNTNPFVELSGGTEGTFNISATASLRIFRNLVLGKECFGAPAMSGDSPFSPRVMIVPPGKAEKSDPLGQFGTAGWKNYWAASALNTPYGLTLSGKSEFVGT